MTQLTRFMASLLALTLSAAIALAEPRIALIVGNGNYTSVAPLDNPVPDAELMAAVLREKGFDVRVLTDSDQGTLNRGIAQFGRDLRAAGKDATGLFYYAGHAVQSFGENYLLPTDASLTDAADLSLVAVDAQAVLRQMRSARNKTNIMILDACRNNPFQEIPDLNDNGLAEMKAPTGTFLSYSTAPGAVALDGLDGNSPFTKALAREIPTPGVPIEQTFKRVRVQVIDATSGQQTPWDTSSLTGDFFFQPKKQLTAIELQEKQLWDSLSGSEDPVQLMLFLRSYPNGRYQEEARSRLTTMMERELGNQQTAALAPQTRTATAEEAEPETPPQAPVVAAPTEPEADESALIAAAQASGAAAEYQAYLDAFPTGTYAELAAFELKIIADKAARANAAASASAAAPAETTVAVPQETTASTAPATDSQATDSQATNFAGLTYQTPFTSGGAPIEGLSIEQIVDLSPLFAPIEGIPEELWKDQSCSSCHEWTQEALCAQGTTYATADNDRAVSKPHPLGGIFKQGLRVWASEGCN